MTQPESEIQSVIDRLSVLEPTAADAPTPAVQALKRIRQHRQNTRRGSVLDRLGNVLSISKHRYAYSGALLLLLFGLAFSFPTVRAAASEFLGLFRVRKFAAISVSPEQIAVLEQIAETGLTPGELEITSEFGSLTPAESLTEAGALTGLAVRSLTALGVPDGIYVSDGGSGRLTIDLEGARAILEAAGVDPRLLPDALEGELVDVIIQAGVEQQWQDGTTLLQTESPLVEYPDGLDPTVLGQALLQVLGMNEDEAVRLAQSIDWTSTLLLPVPQEFATFNEVTIDDVSGLALASLDGTHSVVMWQKEDVIYLLSGPGTTNDLVSLADSLQ